MIHICKYVDIQGVIAYNQGFEDGPDTVYLLGFDKEQLKPLPVKTYIRRLWLAFESGTSPIPKKFFDIQAHWFSKEIQEWVSDLANHPLRLAAELEMEPEYEVDGAPPRSRSLIDIVDTRL